MWSVFFIHLIIPYQYSAISHIRSGCLHRERKTGLSGSGPKSPSGNFVRITRHSETGHRPRTRGRTRTEKRAWGRESAIHLAVSSIRRSADNRERGRNALWPRESDAALILTPMIIGGADPRGRGCASRPRPALTSENQALATIEMPARVSRTQRTPP